jgi:hypothetical protein
MTPLAVIDLDIPESGCTGRAFLERDLLQTTTLEELQRAFARSFVDAEDEPRMHLIEQLLRKARVVRVSVHACQRWSRTCTARPPIMNGMRKE